ncbi:YcaO-like family protein [Streptomyces sp. ISL-22]|uniref:YcaO-like family protein n=1 Tax=unclassified Streptomyces TaxID=2593676 RepID=UPI001BE8E9E9|nr:MULTISPECIES: YcaO-like family protein [unclassified Streptomyces]MBT2421111.1 YcaO-like family protein [Streptomyces sp. ISL-24]MBT2432754.1 YcaO-like family protein [Streptomyces sp. ISL-22]
MTGSTLPGTGQRDPRQGPPQGGDGASGSASMSPLPEAHPLLDRIIRRERVFAAVPRVRRVPGDPAVYSHTCLPGPAVERLGRFGRYTKCGGAGFDPADSWIAAAAEGLERFYAITYSTTAPYRRGRWSEHPDDFADPAKWAPFAPEQYAEPGFAFRPLTAESDIRWYEGQDLMTGRQRWLPGPAVCFPYLRSRDEERVLPAVTTGLAFGLGPEHAARSALWEVIERDALVLAWHWQLPVRRIDTTAGLPRELARTAELDDRCTVDAYDITSDLGVPACLVILRVADATGPILAAGSACRGSLQAALRKAFLEALQGVPYVRHLRATLAEEWAFGGDFAEVSSFERSAAFYSLFPGQLKACLTARPEFLDVVGAPVRVETHPEPTATLGLDETLKALDERGHRAYAVDMSPQALRADGCAVVRVVVPGLYGLEGAHRFRSAHRARAEAVAALSGTTPDPHPFPHPLP